MCTAIGMKLAHFFFGRTLDVPSSHGEEVVILPRGRAIAPKYEEEIPHHMAIMGMAHMEGETPLFYDAVNERGLCAAALSFPIYTEYKRPRTDRLNLTSYEVIPYVLARAESIGDAIELLGGANIVEDDFSPHLKTTPLHYIFADKSGAITVESVDTGLMIYDNPYAVLTNAPPFPYHISRLSEYMSLSPMPPENSLSSERRITPESGGYGSIGLPGDYTSQARFVRAVYASEHTRGRVCPLADFFHAMRTVAIPYGHSLTDGGEPNYTLYTSAVDVDSLTYYYERYDSLEVKRVRMSEWDLDGAEIIRETK